MTELEAETLHERDIIKHSNNKNEIIKTVKKMSNTDAYRNYITLLKGTAKLKELIRYKGYILYPLWVKIWKK